MQIKREIALICVGLCALVPVCWLWPAAVSFQVNSGVRQPSHTPLLDRWACEDHIFWVETDWERNRRINASINIMADLCYYSKHISTFSRWIDSYLIHEVEENYSPSRFPRVHSDTFIFYVLFYQQFEAENLYTWGVATKTFLKLLLEKSLKWWINYSMNPFSFTYNNNIFHICLRHNY